MKKLYLSFLACFLFLLISSQVEAQYCESLARAGTGADYITNIKIGKIDNTSEKSDYSDFTTISTDLTKSAEVTISMTLSAAFGLDRAYAWIDYNDDKVFTKDEQIMSSLFSGNTATAKFVVSASAPLGNKRLRTKVTFISAGGEDDPCGTFWGETEDYTVKIIASSCPTAGNACDDKDPCTSNDKIDGNCNCIGTLLDDDKDGVCNLDDICAGENDNFDVNRNGIPDCSELKKEKYCISGGAAGTGGDWIRKIRLNTLNNTSTQTAYSNFSNKSTELVQGGTYDIFLHAAAVFDLDTAFAYIDWNQDSIFQATELIKFKDWFDGDNISRGVVNVPANAKLGNARLRTRILWGNNQNYNACGALFGEVEDYTVKIIPFNCPDKGKPCNDGKACTTGDTINQNCDCVGKFDDSDFDGICNQLDKCPDSDDNADANGNGILDCGEHCLAAGSPGTGNDYISRVKIGNFEFKTGKLAYSYTRNSNLVFKKNETYVIEVEIKEKFDLDKAIAFLDFNGDTVFQANEKITMFPYDDKNISFGEFMFDDQKPGKKLLRIRTYFSDVEAEACGDLFGEVEDYLITLAEPNEVDETSLEGVAVFPNPTSDIINITSDELTMTKASIYNMSGQLLQTKNISSSKESFDISNLNTGIYLLKVETNSGLKHFKVAKQ